ncbi:BTAD domain-containing putative transcriptional regulator [Thermopolyspora sp. NPDC052614]|uniref:BTAD domain-containing putative transcriptional regulator n=1 Tax=Thermopolyspora sp. NPDC052614 TaxID=3155682 RepID=UPI0034283889
MVGAPADLGPARQRAVVARLVCAGGQVVSTDRFIEDLWRGQPPPKALATLQVYISNLRRALEPDRRPRTPATVLVSAAPGYRLNLAAEDVDAWRFRALAEAAFAERDPARAVAALDEALGLWEGPAYAEFAAEEWAAPEAAQLEELRLVALERRAEAALELGRHAETVPDLERHVADHPLRENATRLLALAYYRSGRQGDALAALRAVRSALADELGVDPGPALRALEADILAQAPSLQLAAAPRTAPPPPSAPSPPLTRTRMPADAAPPPPAVPRADSTPASPGLIGRTGEIDRLEGVAGQATAHGFRVVWLGGEAGLGKSVLAEEIARRLRGKGWNAATGRCPETDGGAPPAWAWSEIVRTLAETCPIRPDLHERLAPLLDDEAAGEGRFAVARAIGEYLQDVAAAGPLLIVLEDLHRGDEETLRLLRHLAVQLAAAPLLVLATHRPTETTDGLAATWAALAGAVAEHLPLPGLTTQEVALLLRERSGTAVDDATVAKVAERTGGNPLFVREIARVLAVEGLAAAGALPPGVRDLIRRRVARLPAAAQTMLRHAAVLGRDVDADVLIAMHDEDEEGVLTGLEAGVVTGLLTEPLPGRVRFTHVLVRETLYEDIPRLRRSRLHARALAAVERVRPGDVAALGHHALAAATTNTAGKAVEYAAKAAAEAARMYAHSEAAALLEGALTALGLAAGTPAERERDDRVRLDLLCSLTSSRGHAGNVHGALEARAEALAVARRLGDPGLAARALTAYDAPVTWTLKPLNQMDEVIVAALREALDAAHDDATRCRLLAALTFELEGLKAEDCETASAEALDIARRIGDPALICLALNARYFLVLAPRRRDELEAIGRELIELGAAAGMPGYQMQGHHALFMVSLGRCDLAAARHHADRALEHSTSGQLGLTLMILSYLDTLNLVIKGEFDRAERAYTEAADRMLRAGAVNAVPMGVLGRMMVRLARGGGGESLAELRMMYEIAPAGVADFLARVLVAAGRLDEARDVWLPRRVPQEDYYWLLRYALRAEVAVALGDKETARDCYALLLPWERELAGLHSGSVTAGPVAHTLGEVAELLGRADAAAGHYAVAAEVARAVGSPHWERRARQASERLPKTSR